MSRMGPEPWRKASRGLCCPPLPAQPPSRSPSPTERVWWARAPSEAVELTSVSATSLPRIAAAAVASQCQGVCPQVRIPICWDPVASGKQDLRALVLPDGGVHSETNLPLVLGRGSCANQRRPSVFTDMRVHVFVWSTCFLSVRLSVCCC